MIADKLRITKHVTYLYIKNVRFIMDLHKVYIKPHRVKKIDWYTDAYCMDPTHID